MTALLLKHFPDRITERVRTGRTLLGLLVLLMAFFSTVDLFGEEITVFVTETGSKYHVDGCRFLSESNIPMSLMEAVKRGYEPCGVCHPPELSDLGNGKYFWPPPSRLD